MGWDGEQACSSEIRDADMMLLNGGRWDFNKLLVEVCMGSWSCTRSVLNAFFVIVKD